ncbi:MULTISPECIES: methylated-DNA--[protein]-cysteine S-methyltransferase [Asticcacaulis]|uniref:methylated-DNA--[protein]-cysteine S-methyltransferase n=1 Tax=Asticcacaulis TaxID=76890 RepID=UPI001AE8CA8C|nr:MULTISPECIES: methylated-DNA--[protein]-cysteine S-methyltransferase [Asticcacaulis]MBP2158801.1 methylated-DNA-[protein]-cysteine S-methyltransferase [Asticcacaulis solisilvae]MDR6799847.1 methylated-DNA-[protein]-cysteine S-methyltransferase [Asticcacaulis sp. BE141]
MDYYYAHIDTPVGRAALTANSDGALVEFYFLNEDSLKPKLGVPGVAVLAPDRLRDAEHQITEYFAGKRRTFDLPVKPAGTLFQQKVWRALCDIPFGQTISYQQLAITVGDINAMRAVGAANGKNPVSLVIPCHRVIGKNGSLTGYGGGLPLKKWLLAFESPQSTLL